MLLANTADKNVTQIVEKVQNSNVMRYARAVGLDGDNVVVYGKKVPPKTAGLPIFLSERFGTTSNLWNYSINGVVLLQKINDKAKELGINKEIYTTEDDSFAQEKGFTHTIGLPLHLRINYPEFCATILEVFLGFYFGVVENSRGNEDDLQLEYENTKFALQGGYRPDLPQEARVKWREDEAEFEPEEDVRF